MVVIIIGPSGSGKTTVGRALAEALGWPFYEGDDFHPAGNVQKMAAGIPLTNADREPWLLALSALVARLVADGSAAVIACSALERKYREKIVPGAAAAQQVRFVFLKADRAVLAERLRRRRGHFFPLSLLDSQLQTLQEPGANEPAPVMVVDATEPADALAGQISGSLRH